MVLGLGSGSELGGVMRTWTARLLAVRPLHAADEVAEVREAVGREVAACEQLGETAS